MGQPQSLSVAPLIVEVGPNINSLHMRIFNLLKRERKMK